MRNITVSVDEETHRVARIKAAELDTSVSALVRGYLRSLVTEGSSDESTEGGGEASQGKTLDDATARHVEHLYEEARARASKLAGRPIRNKQELHEEFVQGLRSTLADFDARGVGLDPGDNLTREELYDEAIHGPNALR